MQFLVGLSIFIGLLMICAKYTFMKFVFWGLILFGLFIDLGDYAIRIRLWIKGGPVPSAVPLLGFIFVTIGLIGLSVKSIISSNMLFLYIPLALVVHLTIQMLFPWLSAVIYNKCNGRKLLDMTPVSKNTEQETKE